MIIGITNLAQSLDYLGALDFELPMELRRASARSLRRLGAFRTLSLAEPFSR